MSLDEILSLDKVTSSIKQIDMYMSKQVQYSYEYIAALCYKCEVMHTLGRTKDALKNLLPLVVHFKTFDKKSTVSVCSILINIFLDISNYKEALKYINIKKENLAELDKDEYYYDLIRYYESTGNSVELKRAITSYLSGDIPDDKRAYAVELFIKYQYKDMEYEGFYKNYSYLELYYKKNFMFDKLEPLKLMKANALLNEDLKDEAYEFLSSFLKEDYIKNDTKITIITLLMEIHLAKKDYRKASILETEYNEVYITASTEVALGFAKIAIKVSESINDRISVMDYTSKIEELEEKLKEEKKEAQKVLKEKPKKNKININFDIPEDSEEIDVKKESVIESAVKEVSVIEVSKHYKDIEDILKSLTNTDGLLFREVFRRFGISIEEHILPCEIVISLINNGEGFHYKKGRVYEKIFQDEDIIDTIIYELINNTDKSFILNIKDSLFDKNIITKLPYEDTFKSVIGFRLLNSDEVVGAIIYTFFTSEFKDTLIYEKLKMLSNMLSLNINKYLSKRLEDIEIKRNDYILSTIDQGLLDEHDHQITLNKKAKELLNIKRDYLEDSEYMALIASNDVLIYKNTINKIYNENLDKACIKYHINDKFIRHSITVMRDDITRIYGIIEDITDLEAKNKELETKAYKDPLSKIYTKAKLYDDIINVIGDKKFALSIICIENFKMYFDIYGYSFSDDLVYAIGKTLTSIISGYKNVDVYHLDNDKYAILFKDSNDQRAIYNKTLQIINKLKSGLYDINKRLNLEFKAGIFRYTKQMSIKDPNKIIWYASEALLDAFSNYGETVMLYDASSSEKRFKESQIILHISEAIDSGELRVKYKQVVDTKEGLVEYYRASLNLINFIIEENYFLEVIEKRGIKELCNKYLITHTLSELKTFKDSFNSFFHVVVPIYKSILISDTFISFIEKNMNFFKIPYDIITFDIINDNDIDTIKEIKYLKQKGMSFISSDFLFTINNGCNMFKIDIKKYDNDIISLFKETLNKVSIDVIADNISDKADLDKAQELGIYVALGDFFKKQFKLEDIIDIYKES